MLKNCCHVFSILVQDDPTRFAIMQRDLAAFIELGFSRVQSQKSLFVSAGIQHEAINWLVQRQVRGRGLMANKGGKRRTKKNKGRKEKKFLFVMADVPECISTKGMIHQYATVFFSCSLF